MDVTEIAFVGCILNDPGCLDDAVALLQPGEMASVSLRTIFKAAIQARDDGMTPDLVAIADTLKANGQVEAIGGLAFLAEVMDAVPTSVGMPGYAQRIRGAAQLRRLRATAEEILRSTETPGSTAPAKLLEAAASSVLDLIETTTSEGPEHAGNVVAVTRRILERRKTTPITGVSSPWSRLDWFTAGWQPGALYVVAARPGQGKSVMLTQAALHAAVNRSTPSLFASVEMSSPQLMTRMLSSMVGTSLRHGVPDGYDDDVARAMARVSSAPLYIDDASTGLTLPQLRARTRTAVRKDGVGFVAVDYLQLMSSVTRGRSRNEDVGEISRGLKVLARSEGVPVLAAAQLRRLPEGSDRPPQLSDLRESGNIEQDADAVLALWPQGTEEQRALMDVWAVKLMVLKQREGPTGVVYMALDRPSSTLREVDREEFVRLCPPKDRGR